MDDLAGALRHSVLPWRQSPDDLERVLDLVGDARIVLLGEASYGTHEFYRDRARITKALVRELGFAAIAVEGDWPDCARVNRWVRGYEEGVAIDALREFERFPSWMWRNTDVLDLVGWLRDWNDGIDESRRVGFYGLDLYSLHASMDAVVRYLEARNPRAAAAARARFRCFESFGEDPQSYGYATALGGLDDCKEEVVRQLVDIRCRRAELVQGATTAAEEAYFEAERNADVVTGAEEYYRSMFRGYADSWNLRDTHMAKTLDTLLLHLDRRFGRARVVVWAHNSHIGDARATEMSRRGEINLGQLARERFGPRSVKLIGFTTHEGTVTAAADWGMPAERKHVLPSIRGSFERVFHDVGLPAFLLDMRDLGEAAGALREKELLERFIGVVYRPDTERQSHYSEARIADQFDAVIHVDHTRAVEPLERTATWVTREAPETYPTGL